jgi:hypothetical protein
MEIKRYPFRSESSGKVKWLSFEKMMEADSMGCLTIGKSTYRRARDLEGSEDRKAVATERRRPEIISDSAGFIAEQLPDMESHRKANGHRGIEFVPDPAVPGFMRVKASSPRAFQRYIASRGMFDKTSKNGSAGMVTAQDITNAIKLTRRVYC